MVEQEVPDQLRVISQKLDHLQMLMEEMKANTRSTRAAKKVKVKLPPPTPEEVGRHQAIFESLYDGWLSGREIETQKALDAFDVEELRRFADSNNLNVTSKMSKDRVLQLIGARFREKKQLHRGTAAIR